MSEPTTLPQPDRLDELLSVLADRERRAILTYLRDAPTNSASLENLTAALVPDSPRDRDHARIRLHHCHLPTLAETPLLSYDPATAIVQYHGDPDLESLLDALPIPEPTQPHAEP